MNYYKINVDNLFDWDEMYESEYEIYKMKWMIDHNYTLKDLMRKLFEYLEESNTMDIEELFERWEEEAGFDGNSIWSCYEEWLDNEIEVKEISVFQCGRKIHGGQCLINTSGEILAVINIDKHILDKAIGNKDMEVCGYDLSESEEIYECRYLSNDLWEMRI